MAETTRSNKYGIVRKAKRRKKRAVYRYFNKENAVMAIEGWGKCEEIFGFTKGQFSMVDLLEAVLERTGEADVVVSTWTAAAQDLQRCLLFLQKDMARSMLWLVDLSFERRVPEFALRLKEVFGETSVRIIPSHCKFMLVRNEDWNIVIQTSMNLNHNPRLENFWICDDKDFYDSYYELVNMIFALQRPGAGFGRRPKDTKAEFKRLGEEAEALSDLDIDVELG